MLTLTAVHVRSSFSASFSLHLFSLYLIASSRQDRMLPIDTEWKYERMRLKKCCLHELLFTKILTIRLLDLPQTWKNISKNCPPHLLQKRKFCYLTIKNQLCFYIIKRQCWALCCGGSGVGCGGRHHRGQQGGGGHYGGVRRVENSLIFSLFIHSFAQNHSFQWITVSNSLRSFVMVVFAGLGILSFAQCSFAHSLKITHFNEWW